MAMDLRELLVALVNELPDGDDLMPLLSAETRHRQYLVTGLRRNEGGDVVLTLRDVEAG